MDREGNILYDVKINDEWSLQANATPNKRYSWRDVWHNAFVKLGYRTSVRHLYESIDGLTQLCNAAKLVASRRLDKLAIVTSRDVEIRCQEDAFETVRTRVVFSEPMEPTKRCVAFSDDDALLIFVDRHICLSNVDDESESESGSGSGLEVEKVTKVVLFDTDSSSAVCAVVLRDEPDTPWGLEPDCYLDPDADHVVLVACRSEVDNEGDAYELLVLLTNGALLSVRCSLTGVTRGRTSAVLGLDAPICAAYLHELTLFVGTACCLPTGQSCDADVADTLGLSVWTVSRLGSLLELQLLFGAPRRDMRVSLLTRVLSTRAAPIYSDVVRCIALSPGCKRLLVLYEPGSSLAVFDVHDGSSVTSVRLVFRRLVRLSSLPDRDCEVEDGAVRVLRRAKRAFDANSRFRVAELAQLSAVSWWDDDSVVVARLNGRLRIYKLSEASELRNRLGSHAECFALAPTISPTQENAFYIVDVTVRPVDCDDGEEPDNDQADDPDDNDNEPVAVGWMQRAFGAALQARRAAKRAYQLCSQLAVRAKHARQGTLPTNVPVPLQYAYRLMQLRSSTCEELFERKIALEEYGDALELARAYALDVDRVYEARWERARPVTCAAIQDYLAKISMRRRDYILRQCADVRRAPDLIDAQEALLRYALQITDVDAVLQLEGREDDAKEVNKFESDDADSINDPVDDTPSPARTRQALERLGADLSPEAVRLVRARRVLLDALDRLHTFEDVLGGRAIAQQSYRAAAFRRFLAQPLVTSVVELARAANVPATRCCLVRHAQCAAARLTILNELPETLAPRSFAQLLPTFDSDASLVDDLDLQPWRATPDWSEELHLQCDAPGAPDCDTLVTDIEIAFNMCAARPSPVQLQPLDATTLANWLARRAEQVEALSGLVDHALTLVRIGLNDKRLAVAAPNSPLATLAHDLSLLDTLVYTFHDHALSLATLRNMTELVRFRHFVNKCLLAMPPTPPPTPTSNDSPPSEAETCRTALTRYILPYLTRLERVAPEQTVDHVLLLRAALLDALNDELSAAPPQSRAVAFLFAFFSLLREYHASRSAAVPAPTPPSTEPSRSRPDGSKRGLLSALTGGTLSLLKAANQQSSPGAPATPNSPGSRPISLPLENPPSVFNRVTDLLLVGLDCVYALRLPSEELRTQRSLVTVLHDIWTLVRDVAPTDPTHTTVDTRMRVVNYDLEIADLLAKRAAPRPLSKIRAVVRAHRANPTHAQSAVPDELQCTVHDVRLFLTDFLRHTLLRLTETRRRTRAASPAGPTGATLPDLRTELTALLRDVLALADRIQHDAEPDVALSSKPNTFATDVDTARSNVNLTPRAVLELFVGALLGSANADYIDAARSYLTLQRNEAPRPRSSPPPLDFESSCNLIARACADYGAAAASVDDDLLDCARSCLALVGSTTTTTPLPPTFERERRVLRAAELLTDAFGLTVLPVRVRLAEAGSETERLALVRTAVASSADAYTHAEALAQLASTLCIQPLAVDRLVVQHAIRVAQDYMYAYSVCERLIAAQQAAAWRECAELAGAQRLPPAAALRLLGFALTHCDEPRRLSSLLRSVRHAEYNLLSDCFSLTSNEPSASVADTRTLPSDSLSGRRALTQLAKLVPVRDIVDRLRSPLDAVTRVTSSFIPLSKAGAGATPAAVSLARELCSTRLPELGLVRPLLSTVRRPTVLPSGFYSSLASAADTDCWTCVAFANCDRHRSHTQVDSEESQSLPTGSLYRIALALVLVRAKVLFSLVRRHDDAIKASGTPQVLDRDSDVEVVAPEHDTHQCFTTLLTGNALAFRDLLSALASLTTRCTHLSTMATVFDDWVAAAVGPDRLVALICAAYYYALQYAHACGLQSLDSTDVSAFAACRLIDSARRHLLATAADDEPCKSIGQALITRYNALVDLLDVRRLDARHTGVDIDRFLSDAAYRRETVLGLAMTLDHSMLQLALELAVRHQVDTLDVLIAFAENLFDESLDADRLSQMLGEHALPGLRVYPARAAVQLTRAVYPRLDGTRYDQLIVFFDAVAQLNACAGDVSASIDDDEQLASVLSDAERHAAQLRKLRSAFSPRDTPLDFKKLLRFGSHIDEHADFGRILTPQNVHAVASCVARTARCQQLYSRVMRVFLESLLTADLAAEANLGQLFDLHLQQYATQLPPAELADALGRVVFQPSVIRDTPRSLRVRALELAAAFVRKNCSTDDAPAAIARLKHLIAHLANIERQLADVDKAELLTLFDATRGQHDLLVSFFDSLLERVGSANDTDADATLRCLTQFVELVNATTGEADRFDMQRLVSTAVTRVLDVAASHTVRLEDVSYCFSDWRLKLARENSAIEECLSKLRQLQSLSNSDAILDVALKQLVRRSESGTTLLVACLPFALDLTLDQRRAAINAILNQVAQLRTLQQDGAEENFDKISLLLRTASQTSSSAATDALTVALGDWLQNTAEASPKLAAVQHLLPLCCAPFSNILPSTIVEAIVSTLRELDTCLGCIAALNTEIEPLHVQVIEFLWNHDRFESRSTTEPLTISDGDLCEAFILRPELCVELRKMCAPDVSSDAEQRRCATHWFRTVFRHLLARRATIESTDADTKTASASHHRKDAARRAEEHTQCINELAEMLEADGFRTEAQTLNKSLRMPPDLRTVDLLMGSLKV